MLGVYLLGIALLLIGLEISLFNKNSEKGKKRLLIWVFFLLVLLMGCRNAQQDYGSDLNNYYRLFKRTIDSPSVAYLAENSTMEVGYLGLNWLLAQVIKWPQFILFFQAAFCCGITLRYIYKHSTDVTFSVLGFMSLGLFQFYLTGFRQSIAIAICLLAFEMAEKKRLIKFLACVLIATMIHQTSIVYLLVYVISNIKVNKISAILDIAAIFVMAQLVPQLIGLGNEVFDTAYVGNSWGNKFGGTINLLIGAMITLVMVYQMRKLYPQTKKGQIFYNEKEAGNHYQNYKMFHILVLGVGTYSMRYQALVLERISLYFTPTMFILLPEVIKNGFCERDRRVLRIILVFVMLFLIYWRSKDIAYIPFWK